MVSPTPPRPRRVSDLKAKLLQPATTSNFECYFVLPQNLTYSGKGDTDRLLLTCTEASLPGSSIATHEMNNDFTGVTERNAYRRLYDDKADFTFIVDTEYFQIGVFEAWMRYVTGEQYARGYDGPTYSYRMNWPSLYKTDIFITKFEKDLGSQSGGRGGYRPKTMIYRFMQAFPTSINSIPVSYDSASLLKVTVSFAYTRYIILNSPSQSVPQAANTVAPGNPEVPAFGVDTAGKFNLPADFNPLSPNIVPNNLPAGTVSNDFLNIGNPALDQFGVRDQLGRGAAGTTGANILA